MILHNRNFFAMQEVVLYSGVNDIGRSFGEQEVIWTLLQRYRRIRSTYFYPVNWMNILLWRRVPGRMKPLSKILPVRE